LTEKSRVRRSASATCFRSEVSTSSSLAKLVSRTRDFSVNALRQALSEIVARFPVYRSYLPQELDDLVLVELLGQVAAVDREPGDDLGERLAQGVDREVAA
jgi:maltooligosyltrehalose synthase